MPARRCRARRVLSPWPLILTPPTSACLAQRASGAPRAAKLPGKQRCFEARAIALAITPNLIARIRTHRPPTTLSQQLFPRRSLQGFYNSNSGADSQTACESCPSRSGTVGTNSTSVSACICEPGHYDSDSRIDVVACTLCPGGTVCPVDGITMETLPLHPGFYRRNNRTEDVRKCPDVLRNTTSGYRGGTGPVCQDRLNGIFCQLCQTSGDGALRYYVKATDSKVATCEDCGGTLGLTFGLLALVCAAGAAFAYLLNRYGRSWSDSVHKKFPLTMQLIASFKPGNKLKEIFSFYSAPATSVTRSRTLSHSRYLYLTYLSHPSPLLSDRDQGAQRVQGAHPTGGF